MFFGPWTPGKTLPEPALTSSPTARLFSERPRGARPVQVIPMRIALLLLLWVGLLAGGLSAGAAPGASESPLPPALTAATPVDLERGGRPLPEVLRDLGEQAGVPLVAGDGLLDQ